MKRFVVFGTSAFALSLAVACSSPRSRANLPTRASA
jgi:hypothetical protein